MMRRFLAAVLCAVPGAASGQSWRDAYRAGDYEKAAELLHPIVAESDPLSGSQDPEPFRHLAVMYARGLGVAPDPIAACSLAKMVRTIIQSGGAHYADDGRGYDAMINDSETLFRTYCAPLSDEDRLWAISWDCYTFGMNEQVVTIGKHAVRVSRRGIGLVGSDAAALECPILVARVRPISVEPPHDAAPGVTARHFVEMISWHTRRRRESAAVEYVLSWYMYEVREDGIGGPAIALLHSSSTWPRDVLPAHLEPRVSFEMIRSGHVRWKFDGTPPRRGWIMLPQQQRTQGYRENE